MVRSNLNNTSNTILLSHTPYIADKNIIVNVVIVEMLNFQGMFKYSFGCWCQEYN